MIPCYFTNFEIYELMMEAIHIILFNNCFDRTIIRYHLILNPMLENRIHNGYC